MRLPRLRFGRHEDVVMWLGCLTNGEIDDLDEPPLPRPPV